MRPLVACSLLFVSACAAIAGLEDPQDPAAPGDGDGGFESSSTAPPPPPNDGGGGSDVGSNDASVDVANEGGRPPSCDANGLIARWKMDEGSGTVAYDCTQYKRDGTISGATWTAGKIGSNALQFDDDSIDVGNPQAFQLTGPMTLSAWINIKSGSTTSGRIISKSSQADRGWELNIEGGGSLEFKIAYDEFSYTELSIAISQNEWHHVAGAYAANNATMRLYVDGALVTSRTDAPTVGRNSPFNVLVGAMPNETCCPFEGLIDDVRVYSRALTTAEVQAVMAEK